MSIPDITHKPLEPICSHAAAVDLKPNHQAQYKDIKRIRQSPNPVATRYPWLTPGQDNGDYLMKYRNKRAESSRTYVLVDALLASVLVESK